MRADGLVTYYFIQHQDSHMGWCESSLENFLFGSHMTMDEHRGALGTRRRALMEPQNASSHLWQEFGIHGFVDPDDARAALAELRTASPETRFRLVRRRIAQHTEEVPS